VLLFDPVTQVTNAVRVLGLQVGRSRSVQ
jgi:hypothetical protein